MAIKGRSAGLTIGQLLTLTVGFLLASVVIFFFGLWVGRDLAQQKLARETEIIRIPVMSPTPDPTLAITEVPTAGATLPVLVPATPTAIQPTVPASPTAARTAPTTPQKAAASPTAGQRAELWTVQASASRDAVQAAVLKRKLQSRGYDSYITEAQIAGTTWYRVQVGKFRDRASAKAVESRLRSDEGLEAAYATRQ